MTKNVFEKMNEDDILNSSLEGKIVKINGTTMNIDNKKCEKYALEVSEINLGKADTICGKCLFACPYTKNYIL